MLSEIQKKYLEEGCPKCGGNMHEVEGENETLLWCNDCDVSMDSDGGYTN